MSQVATGRRTNLQPSDLPSRGGPGGSFDGGSGSGPQRPQGGQQRPQQVPLMYATWSPTGHALAFVFANNIYYKATPTSTDFPVTSSGKFSSIFSPFLTK